MFSQEGGSPQKKTNVIQAAGVNQRDRGRPALSAKRDPIRTEHNRDLPITVANSNSDH